MSHVDASFITLTYNDDNLPYDINSPRPSLCKRDVQLFMKRLRKRFPEKEIRFYLCGEYGERTLRPHYHCIIFGHTFSDIDFHRSSALLRSLWTFGNNYVGSCTANSIQYVAGYVTKKFVNKKRDTITPEFTLMSRKPGIGFYAINSYEQLFNNSASIVDYFNKNGILPENVLINGRSYPLDRYFKWKLYGALDVSDRKVLSKFIVRTLQRQGEAFANGYPGLVEYEDGVDCQNRLNLSAKQKITSRGRDYEETF